MAFSPQNHYKFLKVYAFQIQKYQKGYQSQLFINLFYFLILTTLDSKYESEQVYKTLTINVTGVSKEAMETLLYNIESIIYIISRMWCIFRSLSLYLHVSSNLNMQVVQVPNAVSVVYCDHIIQRNIAYAIKSRCRTFH